MMTIWDLLELAAWVLSALTAGWLLYDAAMISRRYSEEFLTHTIEDLGDGHYSATDGATTEGERS
jgi:hypothetical protein